MLEIEKSFASNVCRCTGYRSILEAFKQFAVDNPTPDIVDIEDLNICRNTKKICSSSCDADWCIINETDAVEPSIIEITLNDGKKWFRPTTVNDVLKILKETQTDNYQLVAGNTAKGMLLLSYTNVYKIKFRCYIQGVEVFALDL